MAGTRQADTNPGRDVAKLLTARNEAFNTYDRLAARAAAIHAARGRRSPLYATAVALVDAARVRFLEADAAWHAALEEPASAPEGGASDLVVTALAQRAAHLRGYTNLADLEVLGLVPTEQVEYGTAEYFERIRLGLPLCPPPVRPGQWAYNEHADHNALVVSVSWDRPVSGCASGWRTNFYGYSTLGVRWHHVHAERPFVDYVREGNSARAILPGLTIAQAFERDMKAGAPESWWHAS